MIPRLLRSTALLFAAVSVFSVVTAPTQLAASRTARPAPLLTPGQVTLVEIARSALPASTTASQRKALEQIAAHFQAGQDEAGRTAWTSFVTANGKGRSAEEIAAWSNWMLRNRLFGEGSLGEKADAVAYYDALTATIRTHLTALRNLSAQIGDAPSVRGDVITVNMTYAPRQTVIASRSTRTYLKAQLTEAIDDWETKLNVASASGDTAQFDLQAASQNQTAAVTTISTMQKTMHDAAMVIIGNLRG